MSAPRPGDMSAGLTGLLVASVFLLALLSGIVHLTNRAYAGHERGGAESGQQAGEGRR